jgi:5-methylcytosine-specific restriction protein A
MALRMCKQPGCRGLAGPGMGGYCADCQQRRPPQKKEYAGPRLYDSERWRKARRWFLYHHPYCKACDCRGVLRQAVAVDHIRPHRGDPELFWDTGNWQSLCESCHNSKSRAEQAEGAKV